MPLTGYYNRTFIPYPIFCWLSEWWKQFTKNQQQLSFLATRVIIQDCPYWHSLPYRWSESPKWLGSTEAHSMGAGRRAKNIALKWFCPETVRANNGAPEKEGRGTKCHWPFPLRGFLGCVLTERWDWRHPPFPTPLPLSWVIASRNRTRQLVSLLWGPWVGTLPLYLHSPCATYCIHKKWPKSQWVTKWPSFPTRQLLEGAATRLPGQRQATGPSRCLTNLPEVALLSFWKNCKAWGSLQKKGPVRELTARPSPQPPCPGPCTSSTLCSTDLGPWLSGFCIYPPEPVNPKQTPSRPVISAAGALSAGVAEFGPSGGWC